MLTSPWGTRDLKYLEKIMAGCLTLDPHACLPQWRCWEQSGKCHVSPEDTNVCWVGGTESRPQKVLGSYSGLPLSTTWTQTCPLNILDPLPHAERQKEFQTPPSSISWTSLPALKSGMGVSFLWEATEGLLSLTKQRRKHLKKMLSLKELWSCLLKTSRAQDISKSHVFAFV